MIKRKVIIVLGPTGSGKSDIAYKIAKDFNGFLIVADSRQIYKVMDIGTNKDPVKLCRSPLCETTAERAANKVLRHSLPQGTVTRKYCWNGIEECLVNIISPDQSFTLDDWLKACKKEIKNHPDQVPVIVGGTGLYISALVNNYQLQGSLDNKLRQKAEKLLETKGVEFLLNEIKKIDPEIEHKIESTNPRRVLRAYEICTATGQPLQTKKTQAEYEFLQLGIKVDKVKLYLKLDKRAKEQFEQGLVEETESLLKKYDKNLPAMSGIGYRQVIRFLEGEISKEQAIELNQRDNRRYAKRQLTWFKRDKSIKWIDSYKHAKDIIKSFIKEKPQDDA